MDAMTSTTAPMHPGGEDPDCHGHVVAPQVWTDVSARYRRPAPVNVMSVDVEDYFQVSAFEKHVRRDEWAGRALRVEANVDRILALFEAHGVKATFFTLGWIAERCPAMVRRIVAAGHELASHGYDHTRATEQTRSAFREDVIRTRAILEDTGGVEVAGYRAASYSVGAGNLWALDVLEETGHRYSSSIYPIRHDLYGIPDAPRFAFEVRPGGLLEIPVSTVEIAGRRLPCGGGGYFRLFPYAMSRGLIRRVNGREQQPTVFYFHPWEVDPAQPRIDGIGAKTRLRHYLNLSRTHDRLEHLCRDFRWAPMRDVFGPVT
jgi:polysaccharide deacetylase family protein (PEP-CTERM system associated)